MLVRDVMQTDVVAVAERTPVSDVIDVLLAGGVRAAPVVDADGHLVGMVAEDDLVEPGGGRLLRAMQLALAEGRHAVHVREAVASDVMHEVTATAEPGEDLAAAARRMLRAGVRRMPVVSEGRVVGIICRSDLLGVFSPFGDEEIRRRVDALLARTLAFSPGHVVHARVAGGCVTLDGTVRTAGDDEAIVALVARLPGVVEVRSRVRASRDWGAAPAR